MKNKSQCQPEAGPKKVILLGGFGWNDIGDEAMPRTVILNLRRELENIVFVMISPNPEYSTRYHGVRAIPEIDFDTCPRIVAKMLGENGVFIFNLLRFIWIMFTLLLLKIGVRLPFYEKVKGIWDEMASSNLLFNCGGGNLNSLMRGEILKKVTTHWIAHFLNVPVILSGQTIGPLYYTIDRMILRHTLNRARMITLRDKGISAGRLEQIGVNMPTILDTADDAMSLPSISKKDAIKLIEKEAPHGWLNLQGTVFSVNIKAALSLWHSKTEAFNMRKAINLLSNFVDSVIELMDAKVMLISTDYCPGSDDRVVLKQIYDNVKNKDRVIFFNKEYGDSELKGIVSQSDICIGSRYHFEVFAASLHIPFVGIASGEYQKTKLKGLYDLCGLSKYYVDEDFDKINIESLAKLVERVLEDRNYIKNALMARVPTLKEESLTTIHFAKELLTNAG